MESLGYATFDENIMSFTTKYNENYKDEIKQAKARWNPNSKTWNLKLHTVADIENAERIAKKYNISYDIVMLKKIYNKLLQDKKQKEKIIEMSKKVDIKGCKDILTPDNVNLYPYQQVAVKWIETVGNALIADDIGLGKSAEALTYCYNNQNKAPYLIILPSCVKINWKREIKKFCNSESVCVISGKKTYDLPDVDYYLINYELLNAWLDRLKRIKFQILIMDEIHFIKSPSSMRTRACLELAKQPSIKNIIGLTGTPILNRPVELLPLLEILKIEHVDLNNEWSFKNKYCFNGRTQFGCDFNGANNLDELQILLRSTCMIRRLKTDVLTELPEKRRMIIPLEITNKKVYQKAERSFIKWYHEKYGKTIHANAETVVKIEALKQLAYKGKKKAMIDYINEVLECSNKIIIVAHHRELQNTLYEHYKKIHNTVRITGKMSLKDKVAAEDAFQQGDARIMILSLMGGSVGINLQSASTMIVCELPWNPASLQQMEGRTHRNGQKDICDYHFMIAENTIEEHIINLLHQKQHVIDKSIDGMDNSHENIFDDFLTSLVNFKYS